MIPRWVGAAAVAGALLLGAAPGHAASAPSPAAATPPAPAECLSPSVICTYDAGAWVVESERPEPMDHGPGNPVDALPVLAGVFAGLAMLLGAVNVVTWVRRKRGMRATAASGSG